MQWIRSWYDRYHVILQNKPYVSLIGAAFFSLTGDLVASVATVWVLTTRTEQPALFLTAWVILTRMVFVLASPVVGYLIDSYRPIRVLVGATWLRTLISFLLMLSVLQIGQGLSPWIPVLLLGLDAAAAPVTRHAEFVLTQILVPEEHLTAANALQGIQFDLAYVLGPLLAGLLTDAGGVGMGLALNLFSFFAYLFIIRWLARKGVQSAQRAPAGGSGSAKSERRPFLDSLREGIGFLRKTVPLPWVMLLGFLWNLLIFGPIDTVFPLLTKEVFQGGSFGYGLLMAANSTGFILGLIIAGGLNWRWPMARSFALILAAHGLLYILVGLAPGAWMAAALVFLGGLVTAPTDLFSKRIRQKLVPLEMQGRVSSFSGALGFLGSPLGAIGAGGVLQYVGGGVAGMILTGCGLLLMIPCLLIAGRREMKLV